MTDTTERINAAHRRIDHVEKILDNHGAHLEVLAKTISENTSSLAENTKLTQEIAVSNKRVEENTSELVVLFKGAKAFRKFIIWTAGIAGAITAIVALITMIWQWFWGR